MKRCGVWLLGTALALCGCSMTVHKSLHSDTTLTTPSAPTMGLPAGCSLDEVVWRGTLSDGQSVISLCTTKYGYRLHRQYPDGHATYADARPDDVGPQHKTPNGGFWFNTADTHHTVDEGTETAIYEMDQVVPNQGFLPAFVSGVVMNDGVHVNRTRTHF